MKRYTFGFLALLALLIGSQVPLAAEKKTNRFTIAKGVLGHKETYFVDEDGKVVIMHGMNIMNKDAPYFFKAFNEPNPTGSGTIGESWAKLFASNGFNVARVGIMWQAVEPAAGVYDDSYILQIREMTRVFAKYGIYVILDFHQDSWTGDPIPGMQPTNQFFGDGFPVWAANYYLNGVPQQNINIGDLNDPALNTIWDNFWHNVPAFTDNTQTTPDVVGVQDRFINMAQHVSGFFKHEKNLLYYGSINEALPDLQAFESMNEPTICNLINNYDCQTGLRDGYWPPSIMMQDAVSNNPALLPVTPSFNYDFFLTYFNDFHQRLAQAIRVVDPVHMIGSEISFYEDLGHIPVVPKPVDHNIVLGRSSYGIENDNANGQRSLQGELVYNLSPAIAKNNDMGFFAQEWGALIENDGTVSSYPPVMHYFDENKISWTYWAFAENSSTLPVQNQTFSDISSVAGWFVGADDSGTAQISWNAVQGNPPGSMQLTIPAVAPSQQQFVTFFPAGDLSTGSRTISVDLIVDPSSGTPAGSYQGFFLLFSFNGTSTFVTQLQGNITTGLNHFSGPIQAPADNFSKLGLLIVNYAGGPATMYVDNLNISGAPFQFAQVADVIYGTNAPATGSNVNTEVLDVITEPYPRVIAGTPIQYGYDPITQVFAFEYSTRKVNGCGRFEACSVTEIAVPTRNYPNGYNVKVNGGKAIKKKKSNTLLIAACKNADNVSVVITPKRVQTPMAKRAIARPKQNRPIGRNLSNKIELPKAVKSLLKK